MVEWIAVWYNRKGRHTTLGYSVPSCSSNNTYPENRCDGLLNLLSTTSGEAQSYFKPIERLFAENKKIHDPEPSATWKVRDSPMSDMERNSLLLFLSLVALVYVMAGGILFRWLKDKLRRRKRSYSIIHRRWNLFVLGLTLLGIGCFVYGMAVEPYWPEITHVRIRAEKLKPGSSPIRIVHLSDLHSDPKPRLEERLPILVEELKPDLIVFTGDCINSPEGLTVFKTCLRRLSQIAPTFAVKGNWDTAYWHNLDLFGDTGATELNGTPQEVEVKGSSLWLIGLASGNEGALNSSLGRIPPEAFKVFLFHYPDLIEDVSLSDIDLYCAGHTHGGQVALPFYGALVTLSKYGKRFESGLYQVGRTSLYVSRGVGMEGGPVPRVRFFSRPEVTLIEIVSAS